MFGQNLGWFSNCFKILSCAYMLTQSTLELTTVNQVFSKNHFFGFKGYWNGYFQQKLEIYFCRKITVIFHTILLEELFFILVYCSVFYYYDTLTYWHDFFQIFYLLYCFIVLLNWRVSVIFLPAFLWHNLVCN